MIKIKNNSEWIIYWGLAGLFSVILLCLIWVPSYFPSQDGPSHLYNAWIMKALGNPEFPLINSSYDMRWGLFPNWTGHAVIFLLMHIFSPITAEKIWLSLIILGLPAGVIYLSRAVAHGSKNATVPWWTLLGFFFTLNHPLYKGFQNHGMGLVLFIFILAYFWKNNIRGWSALRLLVLNILLISTYFCHIVPFVLSLMAMVILRLCNRESINNNLRFFAALIPMGLLLLYYRYSYPVQYRLRLPGWYYLKKEALYLLQGKMLTGFNRHDSWYIALSVLIGIGIIGMLWSIAAGAGSSKPGDKRNQLIILVLFLSVVYFISPDAIGGGKYLNMRLALYPLFPLIVWLKAPRNMPLRILLICAIILLTVTHFRESFSAQKEINKHYNRIVQLARELPDDSFAAAARNFPEWNQRLRPILHAISYGIIGRDIVNLTNYEARLPYFPIKWKIRPELKWPIYYLEAAADDYTISPLDKTKFPEELFYSKILTGK
jgi:hypothetical protein